MSLRKLLLLLLVPLALIAIVGYFALSGVGDEATPRADAIGRLVGNVYGIYAAIILLLFFRARMKRA